jgi:hypothetical protein
MPFPSLADGRLLSGVMETSHFKGVTIAFGPIPEVGRFLRMVAVVSQNIGVAKHYLALNRFAVTSTDGEVFGLFDHFIGTAK